MDAESVKKSFDELLEKLASGGCIDEETRSALSGEFDRRVEEASSAEDSVKAAIDGAAARLKDEVAAVHGEDGVTAPEAGGMTAAEAFKGFLASIPKENLEAFNDLVASFSDVQRSLGRKVIDGDVQDVQDEHDLDADVEKDGEAEAKEAEAEKAEAEATVKEACEVISAMHAMLDESGLRDVGDGILSEASGRLRSLTKQYEREYERFLKDSIRQMARQNRQNKLTGGVVGAASRENDYGKVLKELRKKLYMSESALADCRRSLSESASEVEALKGMLDEATSEASELRRSVKAAESMAKDAEREVSSLRKDNARLEEAAKAASDAASSSEAKAFLAESVSGLSDDLKSYLSRKFSGCGVEEVRRGLNEAIEAYRGARRDERMRLRVDDVNAMSRRVNEAVDGVKVDDGDDDQIVAGFVRMSDSLSMRS